ncbi:cytochrome-c oxidase, cbb3-type subunit III [Dokdonella sp. MW10]|uniref:cytochrome-c oxidase, cbb3-type subunit III n=1 Tax=Dokdonella sp. MW10 TaxID=2992926 RepID=UPI003F80FECD
MNTSWSWYVIALTFANIIGLVWLLVATARTPKDGRAATDTMGHVWDGDIEELNHPLPRWWLWMFVLTIVFGIGYLVFYPGLGNVAGRLGWTSPGEVERTLADTNARLETLYAGFRDRPLEDLASDPAAIKVGRNVFANHCAACHGSDARGADGYPNLVDDDWLYGGDPQTVLASILHGRNGMMPPMAATLPGNGIDEVANHVLALSGQPHDTRLAAAGKPKFETICAACHGVAGKGNPALGAPNLTDEVWLHGRGDLATIRTAITQGRRGTMPAWEGMLGADRSRLAAAWLLSQGAAMREADAPAVEAGAP